jgi:protein phosphatase PTC7
MSDLSSRDEEEEGPLQMAFGTACFPHPDKADKGGEDSFFACPATRSFGVADGVGGFAEMGVDPGVFARKLLEFAHEGIQAAPAGAEADLEDSLMQAAARLNEERHQGGCTALLGQVTDETLAVLNLGDSGVMLLRPAWRSRRGSNQMLLWPRVFFRSSDQTHHFNCPYQLTGNSERIEVPDLFHIRVRSGDIVVAATDGVFDNLFDHVIQGIVARHLSEAWRTGGAVQPHLEGLATTIAEEALEICKQDSTQDHITPFAIQASSEGITYRGGKLDDITVVVGLVCHQDVTSEQPPADPEAGGQRWDEFLSNFHREA